jgi:predicted RNA-binding Zn-ribbon protein involved in translation (DUF1610 family)
MMRKTFNIVLTLAAIGALVCSIVGSPNRLHVWDIAARRTISALFSARGFGFIYSTVGDPLTPDIRIGGMGFGVVRGRMYSQPSNAYSNTWYAVFCPRWFIVGLLGAYPVFAFVRASLRRWRHRRDRRGLCSKCEYDLTGNVSGVCPECGTAVPRGAKCVAPPDRAEVRKGEGE